MANIGLQQSKKKKSEGGAGMVVSTGANTRGLRVGDTKGARQTEMMDDTSTTRKTSRRGNYWSLRLFRSVVRQRLVTMSPWVYDAVFQQLSLGAKRR